MIGHLRGREKALEPFGWTGRKAEWIALVCLHAGVFTRAQLCFHLQINRWRALRFVRALTGQGSVAEDAIAGRKVCRIFSRRFYRALGAEDIRRRRIMSPEVLIRRLLSLDYVLEHPELSWLPTESEKVRCFERLGIPRRKLPQRVCRGAVGNTRRYFALKLPIAVGADTAVFVHVDPGHSTDKGLRSWGVAHGRLWAALRQHDSSIQVVAVAREDRALQRAETVLRRWAGTAGSKARTGDPSAAREYARIKQAVLTGNKALLNSYGGVTPALKRAIELEPLMKGGSVGATIDGYSTWRTTRLLEGDFGR